MNLLGCGFFVVNDNELASKLSEYSFSLWNPWQTYNTLFSRSLPHANHASPSVSLVPPIPSP